MSSLSHLSPFLPVLLLATSPLPCSSLSSPNFSSGAPTAPPPSSAPSDAEKNVDFEGWIADAPDEVSEWTSLTDNIEGRIPEYVRGTLVRNGGGLWSSARSSGDDAMFSHIFDGFAKISAYRINCGAGEGRQRVSHQTRFLRSNWWNALRKNGGKLSPSMGVGPILDGKTGETKGGFLHTASALVNMATSYDNAPVNIFDRDPLRKRSRTNGAKASIEALTDAPPRATIDFDSLRTTGTSLINPSAKGARGYELLVTAHPLYSATSDESYNVAVELSLPSPRVNLVRESPHGDRVVVGSFGVPDGIPYMHSFGLSKNYAVVVLQPLRIDPNPAKIVELGFLRAAKRVTKTRVVVMDLSTGDCVVDNSLDEDVFFYHSISTAELDGGNVSLRLCAYREPDQLNGENQFLRLEKARRGKEFRQKLHRGGKFCDVVCDPSTNHVCVVWRDGEIRQGFELPVTRYSRSHGGSKLLPPHPSNEHPRYVYSFGAYALGSDDYDDWGMFKFDTREWKVAACYQQDSVYLSEPAFVPRPDGSEEDDGVLLSQAYFGKESETKLLVIDAKTMEVLASVGTGMRTPMDFHGAWIPEVH